MGIAWVAVPGRTWTGGCSWEPSPSWPERSLLSWRGHATLAPGRRPARRRGLPVLGHRQQPDAADCPPPDPVQIAMLKGLVAGTVNLGLAFASGAACPAPGIIAGAALVGFLGYGVSLALFVLGLRHLGAARTGAYFSLAPFVGAALAVPMLGEPSTSPC